MFLLVLYAGIELHGDTIFFPGRAGKPDTILLHNAVTSALDESTGARKAKVTAGGGYCVVYDETYFRPADSIVTGIVMYDSLRRELWRRKYAGPRKISFDLTGVYDGFALLVTTDFQGRRPQVELVRSGSAKTLIASGKLRKIIDYRLSGNARYLALHVNNPYNNRTWDYIYFVDVKTDRHWSYLFPVCLTCKRAEISLSVDDAGQVTVGYRAEHRVFSRTGQLIDIYIKD